MFVSFILRDQLAWDLHLGLAPEQVGAMRLGDNKSALLGWTSFLGTPEERPSVTIRGTVVNYDNHGAEYAGRETTDAFIAGH